LKRSVSAITRVACAAAVVLLAGCIQPQAREPLPNYAALRTWHEIVSIDGETPDERYSATLSPGAHTLQIRLPTYRYDYLCRFEFEALAGRNYEIVDHSNPEPLILYRWRRANGLWAERLDPVLPTNCDKLVR
jgi:hypothetical protein